MTIQQLRTAMEAARTGSITQAAKNLYLSQPNASSMLRTLEQELGYEICRISIPSGRRGGSAGCGSACRAFPPRSRRLSA